MTGWVHEHRQPVSADNPFVVLQENFSRQVVAALDAFRDLRDGFSEATFLTVYGSPAVQAWFGIDYAPTNVCEKPERAPCTVNWCSAGSPN